MEDDLVSRSHLFAFTVYISHFTTNPQKGAEQFDSASGDLKGGELEVKT